MKQADGFRNAEKEDRELFVRAAVSVILQRELSLTRRVYTWLLGSDETPEKQINYFRRNGLNLLSETLQVS